MKTVYILPSKLAYDPIQLKLMSQTVFNAAQKGTLENALFASTGKVSEGAQEVFNGVYRVNSDGKVVVDKALQSGFWSKVGAAASSAWTAIKATGQSTFSALSTSPLLIPLFVPPGIRDQMLPPIYNGPIKL
ncbi:MAG: hypothetical protein GY803_19925 [Chloroflexi bacterium]|nr:hypothetical protein [Chloroflexota bacterium]